MGTVLVVDDSSRARQALGSVLSGEGCQPVFARNGFEAVTALKRSAARLPDLILIDLMWPGMSGAALLKIIRAHPRWGSIPVIVIGAGGDFHEGGARPLAVVRYLIRSRYSDAELLDAVRELVTGREAACLSAAAVGA